MDESVNPEPEMGSREDQLAALADGSLPAERRRALEDEISRSPKLSALLAEQQLATSLVRGLDVTAPPALRAHVNGLTRERASRRRPALRPRLALVGGAAAAVVAVLALALPGGVGGPTVIEAANLSTLAPTQPAPPQSPLHSDLLTVSQSGVSYPDWEGRFAWRATGVRTDTLGGRTATTVFYTRGPSRIGYSIVSGNPLTGSGGWRTVVRSGVTLHVRQNSGLSIVTWERGAHSCVLSGRHVDVATLESLASWHGARHTLYR